MILIAKLNPKKKAFLIMANNATRDIDHLSPRQLDYRFHEYELFKVLVNYNDQYDFSGLKVPDTLSKYDIYTKSPVTLNEELHKLYESNYFTFDDDFAEHVAYVSDLYKNSKITVNALVELTKKVRHEFERKINYIKDI